MRLRKRFGLMAIAMFLPGCSEGGAFLDFGRAAKVEQNQTEMQNVIERFIAESASAGDGSLTQLAERLSSMRQQKLDLKQVVALKECADFQTDALGNMDEIVDIWSSIRSVDCDVGSGLFDYCLSRWREDTGEKAAAALSRGSELESSAVLGCSVD